MKVYYASSSNINENLPYSNLNSFDSFKEQTHFLTGDNENFDPNLHLVVYSDRLRSYKNYSELKAKYSIKDVLNGTKVSVIQDFVREILSNENLKIVRIKETIDGRGYQVYQIMCLK